MTREEARKQLIDLTQAITTAVMVLRPYAGLIRQFQKEPRDMENFGSLLNPTLFNCPERRAVEAFMAPMYDDALRLIEAHDRQCARAKEAMDRVRS